MAVPLTTVDSAIPLVVIDGHEQRPMGATCGSDTMGATGKVPISIVIGKPGQRRTTNVHSGQLRRSTGRRRLGVATPAGLRTPSVRMPVGRSRSKVATSEPTAHGQAVATFSRGGVWKKNVLDGALWGIEAHAGIFIGSTANKDTSASGSIHTGVPCHSSATTSYDLGLLQGVWFQSGAGRQSV